MYSLLSAWYQIELRDDMGSGALPVTPFKALKVIFVEKLLSVTTCQLSAFLSEISWY